MVAFCTTVLAPLSASRRIVPSACASAPPPPSPSLLAERQRAAEILRADLLRQYDAPQQLDWDLYDRAVTFDDPMTKLSGRLQYKGMIFSIALIVRALFRDGRATFTLSECALTPDADKVRTTFETVGVTRWGARLRISGVDYFWFAPDTARFVRHESTWDQTPQQVTDAFLGKNDDAS